MNLEQIFAVLKPNLSVETVPVSTTIYQTLDEKFNLFKSHVLISTYTFESDWTTWEKHPAGDEIVVLLSGAAQMVMYVNASVTADDEISAVTSAVKSAVTSSDAEANSKDDSNTAPATKTENSLLLNKVGDFVRIPQGVWHTARIHEKTTLLFITPGEGTEHGDKPI